MNGVRTIDDDLHDAMSGASALAQPAPMARVRTGALWVPAAKPWDNSSLTDFGGLLVDPATMAPIGQPPGMVLAVGAVGTGKSTLMKKIKAKVPNAHYMIVDERFEKDKDPALNPNSSFGGGLYPHAAALHQMVEFADKHQGPRSERVVIYDSLTYFINTGTNLTSGGLPRSVLPLLGALNAAAQELDIVLVATLNPAIPPASMGDQTATRNWRTTWEFIKQQATTAINTMGVSGVDPNARLTLGLSTITSTREEKILTVEL